MAKHGKRFVSGELTVDIKYNDRGHYVAKVCRRARHRLEHGECERVVVGVPKHIDRAVDSPRSVAEAAQAAISFSKLSDYAMMNPKGTGWSVSKPRRGPRRGRR